MRGTVKGGLVKSTESHDILFLVLVRDVRGNLMRLLLRGSRGKTGQPSLGTVAYQHEPGMRSVIIRLSIPILDPGLTFS